MVFKFLSNLWLTHNKTEFTNMTKESTRKNNLVKLDITTPNKMNMEMTSHAFLNMKTVLVLHNDIQSLIEFLKEFVVIQGGGQSYMNELETIIKMNLGL
jgi:hydroxymethylpyrimidine/phosphomethylpyrimidine kinase